MDGAPQVQAHGVGAEGRSLVWQVEVDGDTCIGSGMCAASAPRHFELVAGVSRPLAGQVEPDEVVRDAATFCPVEAITVRDADTAEVIAPEP